MRLADRTVPAAQEATVAQHDIDIPSVRTRIEHDPFTHHIVRCTVFVKCTCGVEVSASAADLAHAANDASDLICDHVQQANGESGDCAPPLAVDPPAE
jgi:hypothetical protein